MSNLTKRHKSTKVASVLLTLTTAMWMSGAAYLAPAVAQAQTVEELQAQIQTLLAQIATLQSQLAALQGGGSASGFYHVFNADLSMGDSNNEVKALQEALDLEGCFDFDSYTGYFGPITKSGVTCFQEKYASEVLTPLGLAAGTGYFGPSSRTKMNALYGTTAPAPVTGDEEEGEEAVVTPTTGVVTVKKADVQPESTLAPQNAARLSYTNFVIENGTGSDVTVDSVTVERSGLAQDASFAGVVLLDEDGFQITNTAKTFNSVHQAVLTDDFVVPAGESKTYTIAANMASSLSSYDGQIAYLTLAAVSLAGGDSVSGDLPFSGAGHTNNASLSLGSATLLTGANDPGTAATKEVGTTGYKFGALKLTAGSAEDVTWEQIRLNQSGSASSDDIQNVVVVDNKTGDEYSTTVSSDGKYYTAKFGDGLKVKKGESREVYFKADIVDGSNRTIDFDLWKYEDIVVKGNTYGYYIIPSATEGNSTDNDAADFNSTNPRWSGYQVEIGTGSIRAQKDNTVASQNIASGGDDQPLGAFAFEVKGEPVTFSSWAITVVTTTGSSSSNEKSLTNVTVYDEDGNAVAGPQDAGNTSSGKTLTFTDSITIPVGTHVYTFRGNLDTDWGNNDTIVIRFNPSSAITSVTGDVSGTTITPTPDANVDGNTMTVRAGKLVISPSSALSSQNVVQGGTDVELGRYILDASNSGEDLRVTVAKIRMTPASSLNNNQLNSLQLRDGDTALNTGSNLVDPSSSTSAATQTFTLDNNLIVPKGTTKVISLYGNVGGNAQDGGTVKFDFSSGISDGDWTVTGVDTGTEITETFSTSNGATFTVKTSGGWRVALDSSSPTEKWYSAGAQGVTLSVLRFSATTEQFAVTDLRLTLPDSDGATNASGSSTPSDISKLYIFDGDTLIASKASPAFTSEVEDFDFPTSGTGSLIIPRDSFKRITIKADLASIGANLPGISGHLVKVEWGVGTGHRSDNKAVGDRSGSTVNVGPTSLATTSSNGVRYFRSVPTIANISLSEITGGLLAGKLYAFSVTADSAYDVGVQKFTFKVATSGGAAMKLDNFVLRDETESLDLTNQISISASTTAFDSSGDAVFDVVVHTNKKSDGHVTIPAGTTHKFTLRADTVTLTSTTGEGATTRLEGDAGMPDGTLGAKNFMHKRSRIEAATHDDFIWTDFAADATTTHSFTTNDWMNGYKVPGFDGSDLSSFSVTE